jgi:hypothetical protein
MVGMLSLLSFFLVFCAIYVVLDGLDCIACVSDSWGNGRVWGCAERFEGQVFSLSLECIFD